MLTAQHAEKEKEKGFSLERVADLANSMSTKTETAINQIDHINGETHVLAINALIEASRAGEAGKAFSVVAGEMSKLSKKIADTTDVLRKESRGTIAELGNIIKVQATNIRGTRLSDLALTNIDLIDRNLFERSADVRWWAKDLSIVTALNDKTKDACEKASNRLGVILDSYTVYYDLVICDLEGNVVANGRPQQFKSQGTNHHSATWFRTAIDNSTVDNSFGFETVHKSPLVNGQMALVFSCAVRESGASDGKVIGVLGVVFNWEGLAQKIMDNTPLSDEEKANSRICIVDDNGLVLADTKGLILQDNLQFSERHALFGKRKGFVMTNYDSSDCCIAHALSPGYENYASGWHSVIIQKLKK